MKSNRREPLPEDFALTNGDVIFFQMRNPNKDWGEQFECFKDYHLARGTRFVDWRAAWRTWSRNCAKFAQRDNAGESYESADQFRQSAKMVGQKLGHMGPGMANLMRMHKEAQERENGQCEPTKKLISG